MERPFSIIRSALEQNLKASPLKHRTWRDSLRSRLPVDALHTILADLAEGRAWMAELPDGKCSVPVLPSSDVRLRAAMFLHEALYGKAVAQTEIQKAEAEAKDFEAVRALDDDQLEAEAAKILTARRVQRLSEGTTTEAEFIIEKDEQPSDLAARIWAADVTTEQGDTDDP